MQRDWNITRKIVESKVPAEEKALYEAKSKEEDGYVDLYEQRQDKIIEKDPETFAKTNRVWQFEYLRDRDLPKDASFLDYGCGPAAAGVYFIEYLDAGKYVGTDISKKSIDVGEELIRARGLEGKKPRLLYTPKGEMAALEGETFDIMWAQSVFTHLPPDAIEKILIRLRPHMHAGSRFYSSISRIEKGIVQQQLHNWYQDLAFYETIAPGAGMKVSVSEGWVHPYQHNMMEGATSTLLKFTPA
jgi:SAM-dependent methyltransferase